MNSPLQCKRQLAVLCDARDARRVFETVAPVEMVARPDLKFTSKVDKAFGYGIRNARATRWFEGVRL